MSDRSIKVKLEAEVSQYTKDLEGAAKTTEKLAVAQELAGKNAEVAASKQREAAAKVAAAEKQLKQARDSGKATNEQLATAERKVSEAKRNDFTATQNLKAAEQQLAQAKDKTAKAAASQSTRMGKLNGFLERTEGSGSAASASMAALGGSITAVGLAAMKTGVEYNTLQQSSRAALTTLLGSAEAASEQMDKLDAFAKTSPFAKSTFITAQQQMLAFGIEAKKVVPYMEAINDAVAAAGGSSQDFGEIAFVLSQIQAAGKITATDLMQLGQRGVNAAELIGSQMGMTGAQIKQSISDGSLGATEALDALTSGMSQKFDGASDNVKNTMVGASDRIKAAWRDLASELAEPLVGKEGGGGLVALANNAADAMRAFQGLPEPVKATVVAMGGLTALSTVGLAGFFTLGPKVRDQAKAFQLLRAEVPKVDKVVGALGKTAAIAGTAITAMMIAGSYDGGDSSQGIEEMEANIRKLGEGAWATDTIFKNMDLSGFEVNLAETLKKMSDGNALKDAGRNIKGAIGDLLGKDWRDDLQIAEDEWNALGSAMSAMATTDLTTVQEAFNSLNLEAGGTDESAKMLMDSMPGLRDALVGVADDANLASDDAGVLDLALGRVKTSTQLAAEAAESARPSLAEVAEELSKQAEEADAAHDSFMAYIDGVLGVRDAKRGFEDALDDAREAIKKNGETLDITTEKGRENQAMIDDIVSSGMAWVEQEREEGASQERLAAIMQKTRDKFIAFNEAAGMGAEEAARAADAMGLIPGDVRSKFTFDTHDALLKIAGIKTEIANIKGKTVTITTNSHTNEVTYRTTKNGPPATAKGGRAGLPAFSTGGRMPRTGLGTDQILGVGTDGVPTAWVDDREWIINRRSSDKYDNLLKMINRDDPRISALASFATGGRVGVYEKKVASARAELAAAKKSKDAKRVTRAEKELDAAKSALIDLRATRSGLTVDFRRGAIDASSGYGAADYLWDASKDSNLSDKRRKSLAKSASSAEKEIGKLQRSVERASGALGEMKGVASGLANGLTGAFQLGGTNATGHRLSAGAQVSGAKSLAAKYKKLNTLVKKLAGFGMSSALLQQIVGMAESDPDAAIAQAQMWVDSGKSGVKAITSAFASVGSAASALGASAVSNFTTSDGQFIKSLSSQEKHLSNLEKSLDNWETKIEKILGKVYGVKGYSSGGFTGNGPTSAVAGAVHGQEFVAHARATAAYRPYLEAMNRGTFSPNITASTSIDYAAIGRAVAVALHESPIQNHVTSVLSLTNREKATFYGDLANQFERLSR